MSYFATVLWFVLAVVTGAAYLALCLVFLPILFLATVAGLMGGREYDYQA